MKKTHSISFKKKGEWPDGSSKPKVILSTDEKIFIVDTTEMNDVANIVKDNGEGSGDDQKETSESNKDNDNDDKNESSNKNDENDDKNESSDSNKDDNDQKETSDSNQDPNIPPPTITSDPIIIPDTGFKDDDIRSIEINDNNANTAVSNAFDNENLGWSNEKDNVLKIIGENVNLPLNLQMKDNQFILLSSGSTINLQGGNLNVLIPNKDDEITVQVENTNDVGISVKGGGKLNIKPKQVSSTNSISLKSNSQLNSSLLVKVDNDKVESITIDSISLFGTNKKELVSIRARKQNDQPIKLNINNLEARKESVTSLENANINSKISIEQPSSLTLNNVGLEKANVLMKLNLNSNNNEPLIQGNINEIPKVFSFEKVEGSPKENNDYVLIKANFNCDEWQSKLNLDNSEFDQKKCRDSGSNGASLLKEMKELVISKKKKNRLNAGQIAGIVLGCVAAVAIIVIVIVCVIKRKNKGNTSSEGKSDENQYSSGL